MEVVKKRAFGRASKSDVSSGKEIIPELQGDEGKNAGLCARIH
jgi:hypothetical protein